MELELEFVDELPASTRDKEPNPQEVALVTQLKEQPGKWARIAEFESASRAGALAYSIHHGKRAAFRDSGIVAKSRRLTTKLDNEDRPVRRYGVFVRFPG